ncbi:MAG: beta-N-acetylhexosaminidase [Planctomycetes bacterium]|nr:beta-N-acetylhexosaminidase [Planctomycetota bacterium]
MRKLCLIPEPKRLVPKHGYFDIRKAKTIVFCSNGNKSLEQRPYHLADLLREILGKENDIKLETKSCHKSDRDGIYINLRPMEDNESEKAYLLEIRENCIIIESASGTGIFYGIQTLRQVINQTKEKNHIPCIEIRDWPSLPLRGIHIDLKYQMPKFNYLLKTIDTLSQYKINCLLLEYENKFPFKSHPILNSRLALSEKEVKGLIDYCKDRYIKVIPVLHSINWIGYILRHKEYAHLREKPDSIYQACPLNPGTFELFTELYDEMVSYHRDSDYFHIGGDELHHIGVCPRCKEKVRKEGRSNLYLDYILKACYYVRKSGKTPMIWGDMFVNDPPQDIKRIPGDIVVLYWDYWSDSKKVDWVILGSSASEFKGTINKQTIKKIPMDIYRKFKKYWDPGNGAFPERFNGFPYLRYYQDIGFKTITSPSIQCYGDNYICPRYTLHLLNISEFCKASAGNKAFGVINTNWVLHRVPWEMTWPGHICSAEFSWSGDQIRLTDFEGKFVRNYWGIDDKSPFDIMRKIGISPDYRYTEQTIGEGRDTNPVNYLPYTKADLYLETYPILKDEIKAFEDTPNKMKILTSLPKLGLEASQSAESISGLIDKSKFNKLSLRHIQLAAKTTEHKASQVSCFSKCEDLLKTKQPPDKELDECINLIENLLIDIKELSLKTRQLLSLSLVKEEVEDAIVRRYAQEGKVLKDYLDRFKRIKKYED